MTAQHATVNFTMVKIEDEIPVMMIDLTYIFTGNAAEDGRKLARQLIVDGFIVVNEADRIKYRKQYKGA